MISQSPPVIAVRPPMIHLLILDVEGVITGAGGSQYPWPMEEMLAVRRALAAAPFACILCTGRPVPYGEAVIQALDLFRPLPAEARVRAHARGIALQGWPSIMENGGYLYDPLAKRPIPHPTLSPEKRRLLWEIRDAVLDPLMDATGANLDAGKVFCLSINPPPLAAASRDRQSTAAYLPLVETALAPYGDAVEIVNSASAIDITPRGVSKASAVRLVMEWTGLAPEQVAGVGDTVADAAWLREVGWSATPANGRAALPHVHYAAEREEAAGLLEILEWLAGQRSKT